MILCFVQTSPIELVAAENNLQKGKSILPYIDLGFIASLLGFRNKAILFIYLAFSSMKLEHETIVVLPPQSRNIRQKVASLFSSTFRHHHTEIITHQSCSLAFSKAHFSVILVSVNYNVDNIVFS